MLPPIAFYQLFALQNKQNAALKAAQNDPNY